MTPEVEPPPVVELPEEWFERSQRAFFDLRARLEHRQRELDLRERELEVRARDLAARADGLRDSLRAADDASQTLMARTHRLREEERALADARAVVERATREVSAREADAGAREARLADAERAVHEREAAIVRARAELEAMRAHLEALDATREALTARLRELGGSLDATSAAGLGVNDALGQLLALKAELEAALDLARSREGEADRRFEEAAAKAAEVDRFARAVRDQEGRLEEARQEIVSARDALLAVDRALARMPYEVVDDFTKGEEFDAYERALRALKRFEAATVRT